MRKKFYRFPNGSYFRLDRISFIGKVERCDNGYRLPIDVGGNTINNCSDNYELLENARRRLLAKLHLEYMPIPLRRIRRCRRKIKFWHACRKIWHELQVLSTDFTKVFFPILFEHKDKH